MFDVVCGVPAGLFRVHVAPTFARSNWEEEEEEEERCGQSCRVVHHPVLPVDLYQDCHTSYFENWLKSTFHATPNSHSETHGSLLGKEAPTSRRR